MEGNSDHVLHLLGGDAEVASDLGKAIAGVEAFDEVLDARAAVHGKRLAKRLARVDCHLGSRVRRQPWPLGPPVIAVGDAFEVIAGDPREMLVAGSNHVSNSSSSLCSA